MTDLFFIFGAKYLYIVSLLVAAAFFLTLDRETKKQLIVFGIASFALAFVLSIAARALVDNPRPFVVGGFEPLVPHDPDNGFPSDHTLLVASVASLISFFNRRYAVVLWLIALLVGISRIYAGVHHPIDILGSIAISITAALIVYATIATWKQRNNQTNF